MTTAAYQPTHLPQSSFIDIRGLRHHVLTWGDPTKATSEAPLLLMVHGWMDVGASFQLAVDALRQQPGFEDRPIMALDWRGFGHSDPSGADSYWFADYLADLDFLLDEIAGDQPIDLLGHSMGGNVVMLYAGVRPQRIRRLINVEGFGMPGMEPEVIIERYENWFKELKEPAQVKDYPSLEAVAARLKKNNPRLVDANAQWLASHWAREVDGRWVLNADPVHKRPQPLLYRVAEVEAIFKRISAPVLFVEGDETLYFMLFNGRYSREEFLARVKVIPDFTLHTIAQAGHMLHHDQPEALATHIAQFLLPA